MGHPLWQVKAFLDYERDEVGILIQKVTFDETAPGRKIREVLTRRECGPSVKLRQYRRAKVTLLVA